MLQLNGTNPPERQTEMLLDLLFRSNQRVLEVCCQVLHDSDKSQIADMLIEHRSMNKSEHVAEKTKMGIQETTLGGASRVDDVIRKIKICSIKNTSHRSHATCKDCPSSESESED